MPTTAMMNDARARVQATLLAGDAAKWAKYSKLKSKAALAWRVKEGHAEFCRLQRLNFHGFI